MNKNTNIKIEMGRKTRHSLIQIAADLFKIQGFGNTTMAQIIGQAGLTKGALYHHFSSKQQLFEAVYIEAEEQVSKRIQKSSNAEPEPWDQLRAGCYAYLTACVDAGLIRILRIDGPAVLGQERWQEIDEEYGLGRLQPFIQRLSDQKHIKVPSVPAFAHQLTGAMNQATFWIAHHKQPAAALLQSKETLSVLLEAVRPDSDSLD